MYFYFASILLIFYILTQFALKDEKIRKRIKSWKRDAVLTIRYCKMFQLLRSLKKKDVTVEQLFEDTANKNPDKTFIRFRHENWSFKKIQQLSNRVANYFQAEGYLKGDKVALFMQNRPEYVAIWLGLAKIGVVPALINYNLRLNALDHCLRLVSCKGVIYEFELTEAMQELRDAGIMGSYTLYNYESLTKLNDPENVPGAKDLLTSLNQANPNAPSVKTTNSYKDDLLYIYSSGTTGMPKACIIKQSRFITYAVAPGMFGNADPEHDVLYTCLPLYHSAGGILGVGHSIVTGTTLVLAKKFSAKLFWKDCIENDVTIVQYIGELCRYLVAQPPKPEDTQHRVRIAVGNGLRPEIWKEFQTRFNVPNIWEFYGSTEGNSNLVNIDNTQGSVGSIPPFLIRRWMATVLIIKVDQNGHVVRDPDTGLTIECVAGEPGELVGLIKNSGFIQDFHGYSDDKATDNKILRDVVTKGDQAFKTGDILIRDECNYLYFLDRQGDTFRWKGENVSTAEVETTISKCLDMSDVAAYGVQVAGYDGRVGMVGIADPNESLDFGVLVKIIEKELPSYARPVFVRILKQIDFTGTFKIKKVELQAEGFDVKKVTDPIYFYKGGKYVRMDEALYAAILSGDLRI